MVLDRAEQALHVEIGQWIRRRCRLLSRRLGWLLYMYWGVGDRHFDWQWFGDQSLWHHDVFGHQSLFLLLFFRLQISYEVVVQVRLPCLLKYFHQEILVLRHELLNLVFVQALVLKLAAVDLAYARPVQVLAGKLGEVVGEGARSWPSVAVACESEFAELVELDRFPFHWLPLRRLLLLA